MKTRKGFVSNSSSSSFILNYYDGKDAVKFSVKEIKEKLEVMFAMYEQLGGRRIDRKCVKVSEINGKEYKTKHKYYSEQFAHIILKDNVKYIEIYGEENEIPYELHALIENLFGASRTHLG